MREVEARLNIGQTALQRVESESQRKAREISSKRPAITVRDRGLKCIRAAVYCGDRGLGNFPSADCSTARGRDDSVVGCITPSCRGYGCGENRINAFCGWAFQTAAGPAIRG